jgi:hypothetical protein
MKMSVNSKPIKLNKQSMNANGTDMLNVVAIRLPISTPPALTISIKNP